MIVVRLQGKGLPLAALVAGAALVALVLFVGCGGANPALDTPGAVDAGGFVDIGAGADSGVKPDLGGEDPQAPPPPSCEGFEPPAERDYVLEIEHDGLVRTALVHVPPGYDGSASVALVLNNHGSMCTAEFQAQMSHLAEAADQRDVIVVHPQGTGGMFAGWNVGNSPMGYIYEDVDDVDYIATLLDELQKSLCIDPKRVFCTGFSLGGSFCYRLACDLSARIAAFASVAGPDGTVTCEPERALPLLHIHGTADMMAGYEPDTDPSGINKGAEKVVSDYAALSGCDPTPQQTFTKGAVSCVTYGNCDDGAEATLCTVEGGGHAWPGGDPWLLSGEVNQDIDASEMILDFFQQHPLP